MSRNAYGIPANDHVAAAGAEVTVTLQSGQRAACVVCKQPIALVVRRFTWHWRHSRPAAGEREP